MSTKAPALAFELPKKTEYYRVDESLLEKKYTTRTYGDYAPRSVKVRRFSASSISVGAEILSFTDKEKDMTCSRTYSGFAADLGISESSVHRGLKELTAAGVIKRRSQSEYIAAEEPQDGSTYLRLEKWTANIIVKVKKKKGGNEYISERPLTLSERLVFALIFTRCDNKKKGTNKYTASYRDMGAILGLSERTVSNAVNVLIYNGLITRSAKGVTRKYKNIFNVNNKLLTRNRDTEAADADDDGGEEKAQTQTKPSRERWYAERKQAAEERAERNERKARSDNRFKAADTELRTLASKEAFAEVRGNLTELTRIQTKRRELEAERIKALRRLNLTPKDLEPQYHCTICSDTGYTPQGRLCGCYDAAFRKGKN